MLTWLSGAAATLRLEIVVVTLVTSTILYGGAALASGRSGLVEAFLRSPWFLVPCTLGLLANVALDSFDGTSVRERIHKLGCNLFVASVPAAVYRVWRVTSLP